jgi:CBS domain-containing protein
MAQTVKDVMTSDPIVLPPDTPVAEAAKRMRANDVGNVLVVEGEKLRGIVTDRDIVVRVLGDDRDPQTTPVGDIATTTMTTLRPSDPVSKAVKTMRDTAVRRLPVVDHDRPVGIVALGDLATERDAKSALAGISAAAPNT